MSFAMKRKRNRYQRDISYLTLTSDVACPSTQRRAGLFIDPPAIADNGNHGILMKRKNRRSPSPIHATR
jgi:hypothetical protein